MVKDNSVLQVLQVSHLAYDLRVSALVLELYQSSVSYMVILVSVSKQLHVKQ